MSVPVFEMQGVSIGLAHSRAAPRRITQGVDLALHRGRTLALVGESGCGKSVTALAALGLLTPPLKVLEGRILLRDGDREIDIAGLDPAGQTVRDLRGRRIAMIFQDPMTALDPAFTVGEQIAEPIRHHLGLSDREARAMAVDLLRQVGIPAPERRVHEYPFQLSGGMRQRVMIAAAIACSPLVLVADEPTTALDVTVQAQILDLLRDLGERLGMATLLITHDLGVVAENADEVIVMYRGHVVERAGVEALFEAPAHPYTRGLLASLPPVDGRRVELKPIPGQVPPLDAHVPGCPFADRCAHAVEACRAAVPVLAAIGPDQAVACRLYPESAAATDRPGLERVA